MSDDSNNNNPDGGTGLTVTIQKERLATFDVRDKVAADTQEKIGEVLATVMSKTGSSGTKKELAKTVIRLTTKIYKKRMALQAKKKRASISNNYNNPNGGTRLNVQQKDWLATYDASDKAAAHSLEKVVEAFATASQTGWDTTALAKKVIRLMVDIYRERMALQAEKQKAIENGLFAGLGLNAAAAETEPAPAPNAAAAPGTITIASVAGTEAATLPTATVTFISSEDQTQ